MADGGPSNGDVVELVKLPPVFTELINAEGTQWTIFKVDSQLNWEKVLNKAHLKLGPDAAPELQKISGEANVAVKVLEDSWHQYLPLQPSANDAGKLVVAKGKIRRIIQISKAAENFKDIEAHVREAEETVAANERRRKEATARQNATLLDQRRKALDRFKVPALSDALRAVGFSTDSSGGGEDDADDVAPQAEDDIILHFRPLSAAELEGGRLPLAFWGTAPLPKGGASQLAFTCHKDRQKTKGMRLVGKFKNAKFQDFVGTRTKASKGKGSGFTHLLGIQAHGSKRIFFQEAEVYHVEMRKQEHEKVAESKLSYGQIRGKLVEDWGTAKKQRMAKQIAARKSREIKVAEFGSYSQELAQRAEELKAKVVSLEDRDAELKAKILPPFDVNATEPAGVYREGLARITPPELMLKEHALVKPELVEFLQKDCRAQINAIVQHLAKPQYAPKKTFGPKKTSKHDHNEGEDDNQGIAGCESRFTLTVLLTRARAEMRARGEEDAKKLAKQVSVLNALAMMVTKGAKHKGGKCLSQAVADLTGLPAESPLAAHWHMEYYDEMVGRRKVRCFNGRKVLCAMVVWGLHLTPSLSLELKDSVARDLALEPGQLKKGIEYVGCTVTEDRMPVDIAGNDLGKVLKAKLEGPPRLNREHYEGKGKGRGNKREGRGGRGGRGGK